MKTKLHNLDGKIVGDQELNPEVFEVKMNQDLVHQVVVAQRANSRQVIAHTKDRSEVRGGGKKPWKQKGTGQARHGSIRSPLWRGGGITFGPRKDRNFSKKINEKMKNKALRMVLSDKVSHEQFVVIDHLTMEDGKTKKLEAALEKLSPQKKNLLVLAEKNETVLRAAKNLPTVGYIAADSLNIVDLLSYDNVVCDTAAVEKIVKVYG